MGKNLGRHFKPFVSAIITVGFLQQSLIAAADSLFSNVEYLAGYPSWNKSIASGTLSFGPESLTYQNTATKEQFLIPYGSVNGIGYKGKITQQDTRGALLGGSNPYVLAATVGASILANILAKPVTSGSITCHFSYVDQKTQLPTMVYFSVPNQKIADNIVATFKERHEHMIATPSVVKTLPQTVAPQEEAALDKATAEENPYLIPEPTTQADLKFGY